MDFHSQALKFAEVEGGGLGGKITPIILLKQLA